MTNQMRVYTATTAIVLFVCASGGAAELMQVSQTVRGVELLGYPAYLVTILGAWKLLGAIAIAVPRFPRLKEWAYAGVFFNLTGAAFSQAASGESIRHVLVPTLFAVCALVSWALRPKDRRLGNVLPTIDTSAHVARMRSA